MTSLRRELASAEPTANAGRVRVITDRVGDFNLSNAERSEPSVALPHHLHALHAPALGRRLPQSSVGAASSSRSSAQVPALARLSSRVLSVLLDPRTRPLPRASAGPGSWTYRVVGWLPNIFVDAWLTAVEGVARWAARHDESSPSAGFRVAVLKAPGVSSSKRPLPIPPIARSMSQTDSSSDEASKRSTMAAAAAGENGGESSEGEPASMAESFVGSEEDWRPQGDEAPKVEQGSEAPIEASK